MALQDHPDGALQSPDLVAFRQNRKKEQSEEAVESCSRRKHRIMSSHGPCSRGQGGTLEWQRRREGPLARELGFHGKNCPSEQPLTPPSPALPCNPSPGRGQLGVNHFQPRPEEVAIKELVSDRRSSCAALTPSDPELLQHLPAEQGEASEPALSAGYSIPAPQSASLLECGLLPVTRHAIPQDEDKTALPAAAPRPRGIPTFSF